MRLFCVNTGLISIRNTIWGEGIEIPRSVNRRYAAEKTRLLTRKRGLKPTPKRGVVATRRVDPSQKCPNPRPRVLAPGESVAQTQADPGGVADVPGANPPRVCTTIYATPPGSF